MSETKTEEKPKAKAKDQKDPAADAIKGPVTVEKTVFDQAKEARGEPDPKEDKGGKVDTRAAEANYTDEQKAKDLAKEAKVAHLESLGLDPENPNAGAGVHKVEPADVKDKMYSGVVTLSGYSGEFHQKVSTRVDLGPTPRGWGWLETHAFPQHLGAAAVLEEVDETNKADPLLRTKHG